MSWYVPPIFRRISWKKQPGNGWLPFSALLGCTPRWDPNWFLVTAALCAIFGVINLGHEIHFFCFVCFFEICFLNLNLQLQGVFCSLVREPFVVIFCCWLKFGSCWVKNSRPNGKRPRSLTKHDFDVPPKSCHWHVQRNMRCIERCIWWAWHEIPTCSCLNGGEQVLDGSSDLEVDQHWFTNIRFHFLSSFFSCLVVFSILFGWSVGLVFLDEHLILDPGRVQNAAGFRDEIHPLTPGALNHWRWLQWNKKMSCMISSSSVAFQQQH